jgi:hypothetical protein
MTDGKNQKDGDNLSSPSIDKETVQEEGKIIIPKNVRQLINYTPYNKKELEIKNKLPTNAGKMFGDYPQRIDVEISTFYQQILIFFSGSLTSKISGGYFKLYYGHNDQYGKLWLEYINPLKFPMLNMDEYNLEFFRIERMETTDKKFPFPSHDYICIQGVSYTKLLQNLAFIGSIPPNSTVTLWNVPFIHKYTEETWEPEKLHDIRDKINRGYLDEDYKCFVEREQCTIQINFLRRVSEHIK